MHTLSINAHLKYIEFLLKNIDSADDSKTIREIKKEFLGKFKIKLPHMLNQHFGIVRLIPLLLIRQELKNKNAKYDRRISIVRHALAHNKFKVTEAGYEFNSDIGDLMLNFSEFTDFLWLIENEFYTENTKVKL